MIGHRSLVLVIVVAFNACLLAQSPADLRAAIAVVAQGIDPANKATISKADLAAIQNPKGAGIVVYAKQGRSAVWMVLTGKAYALNAPSKLVTPDAAWPRDAPEATWKTTNLSPFNAAGELLKIVRPDP